MPTIQPLIKFQTAFKHLMPYQQGRPFSRLDRLLPIGPRATPIDLRKLMRYPQVF